MSAADEFNAQLIKGLGKVKEAQALLQSARAELGMCKICDEETRVLSSAAGDLVTVIDAAREKLQEQEKLKGLKELHPLASNLQTQAAEARAAMGSSNAPASKEERLIPFPRPTEFLQQMRDMREQNSAGGTKASLPIPRPTDMMPKPADVIPRPPMPHELLGLPLPGKLFRENKS